MEPWLVGMQLTMLGCFCSAVGLVLMKHSTDTESHKPLHGAKFWMMGFVFLFINASVIDVFAFSLAPITLVAPFTGVTIVFTTWLASSGLLFVKEELDILRRDVDGRDAGGRDRDEHLRPALFGRRRRECPLRQLQPV